MLYLMIYFVKLFTIYLIKFVDIMLSTWYGLFQGLFISTFICLPLKIQGGAASSSRPWQQPERVPLNLRGIG